MPHSQNHENLFPYIPVDFLICQLMLGFSSLDTCVRAVLKNSNHSTAGNGKEIETMERTDRKKKSAKKLPTPHAR